MLHPARFLPLAVLPAALAFSFLSHTAAGAEGPAEFDAGLRPFFQKYCVRCHDAGKQEGQFRLDTLSRDFADELTAQRWAEVVFRLNAGEMPPTKEPQPKADELAGAVERITTKLKEGEAARMAKRGPVALYRLSREEYGRTVYDLLGVHFDVTLPGALNEDPRWHGFERIGALLTLSPSHVERYFRAAETVVSRAFPEQPYKSEVARRAADDGKWKERGQPGPVRWALWPGHGQNLIQVRTPGLYRVRLQLSALPSFRGRLPHLALWHHGLKRAIVGQDVRVAEDQPTTLEIEAFLPEGSYQVMNQSPGMLNDGQTPQIAQFPFVNTTLSREKRPTGYKQFDDQGRLIFPLLLIDWVETEGPVQLATDVQKRAGLFPADNADLAEARACLQRFATRAWRRPAVDAEIERYVKVLEKELAAGEKLPAAYRSALVGVLTSKNFYYIQEGAADARRPQVNDWELASRLSYFLWSSLPDDELFAAAAARTLSRPEILESQFRRMLGDAKLSRFTTAFPRQWLQLYRVGQFPADSELYPDYDAWLEESMVQETTQYFATVFQENLSLREFLTSDWTVLNPRLAMHYGLPMPPGAGFQKVAIRPEEHRGGLLTHASVLSLTSDGTRHRPVHRGVWVSEAIFGRTPPPPPPNVEPLAPTPSGQAKATIRQQLEAHATHAVCKSCHQKIDPLGFAFDNFDAVGRWRTDERVTGGLGDNPPVNSSGALADGRAFQGPDEFKQLLAGDLDRFAEAFVEQLATYALRRVMTVDDAPQIRAIAAASKADGYKLRTVLENLVRSELFLRR